MSGPLQLSLVAHAKRCCSEGFTNIAWGQNGRHQPNVQSLTNSIRDHRYKRLNRPAIQSHCNISFHSRIALNHWLTHHHRSCSESQPARHHGRGRACKSNPVVCLQKVSQHVTMAGGGLAKATQSFACQFMHPCRVNIDELVVLKVILVFTNEVTPSTAAQVIV